MRKFIVVMAVCFSLAAFAANKTKGKSDLCEQELAAAIAFTMGEKAHLLYPEEISVLKKVGAQIGAANLLKLLKIYTSIIFRPSMKVIPRTPQVGLTITEARQLIPALEEFAVEDLAEMAMKWHDANHEEFSGEFRAAGMCDNLWRQTNPKKTRKVFKMFLADLNLFMP